jgi:peptide/nickel transport system substrate-binding protein
MLLIPNEGEIMIWRSTDRRQGRLVRFAAVALTAGLFVAACGDDDDDPATGGSATDGVTTAAEETTAPEPTTADTETSDSAAPGTSATPGTEASTPASTAAPVAPSDTELTFGVTVDITQPDGHILGLQQSMMLYNVFDTLIRYDENLEPQPGLAESWELSDDGLAMTVTLREGVQFHNGKPLTANDIPPQVTRFSAPEFPSSLLRSLGTGIAGVEVIDDQTFVFELNRTGTFIYDLMALMAVVDVDSATDGEASIGTGPYKFDGWTPGVSYAISRNDTYWGAAPGPAAIEFLVLPDAQAATIQLQSGAVDGVYGVPPRSVSQLSNDFTVLTSLTGGLYVGTNALSENFSDPVARQAVNYALDRARYAEDVLLGLFEPTAIPWPPGTPGYDETQHASYPYDLEQSRALFEQAGLIGETIRISVPANEQALVDVATILQADLGSIGVTLEVDVFEFAQWREQLNGVTYPDLIAGYYGFNTLSPASLPAIAGAFRKENNFFAYTSPEYSAAVDTLLVAGPDEVQDATNAFTQILLDESFVMTFALNKVYLVVDPAVEGAEFVIENYVSFAGVTKDA